MGNQIGDKDSIFHLLAGFSSFHERIVNQRWKDKVKAYKEAYRELKMRVSNIIDVPSARIIAYLQSACKVCFGRKFYATGGERVGLEPQ